MKTLNTTTSQQSSTDTNASTKEKILSAALDLFNEQGVESITVRHIAKHIGMSHGNLCYHFPRKEDIIFALYERVVAGMSAQIALWQPDKINLSMVLSAMYASFALQYEYKFLMIDFVNIMRRLPQIREHFRLIFELRKQQFRSVLSVLRDAGILLKTIPDTQYERLILHSYLMGDFWMSEAEILFTGKDNEKLPFYGELACSMLVPYLTAKGRKEYDAFVEATFA